MNISRLIEVFGYQLYIERNQNNPTIKPSLGHLPGGEVEVFIGKWYFVYTPRYWKPSPKPEVDNIHEAKNGYTEFIDPLSGRTSEAGRTDAYAEGSNLSSDRAA